MYDKDLSLHYEEEEDDKIDEYPYKVLTNLLIFVILYVLGQCISYFKLPSNK